MANGQYSKGYSNTELHGQSVARRMQGHRVIKLVNPNFVIGIALIVSMVAASGILWWMQFVSSGYNFAVQARQVGLVQVGEYDNSQDASLSAEQDKANGGAGFVYHVDGVFYVLSGLKTQDELVLSYDLNYEETKFFERDKQKGEDFLYALQLPLDTMVDGIDGMATKFGNNQTSLAFVTQQVADMHSDFLAVMAELYKLSQQDSALPYLDLAKGYQNIIELLGLLDLKAKTAMSQLRYFVVSSMLDYMTIYNEIVRSMNS